MANRKGKLPPQDGTKIERMVDATMPQRAVIASERPIPKYDEQTDQVVSEVLLMDGIVWRGGRDQVPIVDSHNDKTVRNIFGSIQHMRVDHATGELVGVPVFASDEESQTIAKRMAEGHITDFSITGQPLETIFVSRGQNYTTSRGDVIPGPALIHTKWQPQNASICATGADEYSTVRRSYTDLSRGVKRMDEALLAQLSAMGLPEGMTDPNQILSWVVGTLGSPAAPEAPVENAAEEVPAEVPPEEAKPVENAAAPAPVARQAIEAQIKRALDSDQKRRTEIQAACKLAKIERSFADELCDQRVSVEAANKRIIERMATQQLGTTADSGVRVTESADDKFFAAARDGLIIRSLRSTGCKRAKLENPAAGADEFANTRLSRIAEHFVQRMGVDVRRMAPKDIALLAMGHPGTASRYRVQRDVYHTTGSFQNLLLDATNKSLQAGYEEAQFTWSQWARQASSVDDFKPINRVRLSEMSTPEMVPETKAYPEAKMSDAKESYRVEKYGSIFTVSWETVVNDDLDALGRIPAAQGAACRRKQNMAVYAVLTSNPTMADTGALFNTTAQYTNGVANAGGHANLSGSGAAPSVTTLNAAYLAMMTMKGLKSDVILNIMPAYIIVPAALSASIDELLGSTARPEVGGSAAGNSNTLNIYGPNGPRSLVRIIEPQLDANSATAWYVVASNSQVDTVELAFLAGEESPVLEDEWDFDHDVYKYKVRQTFGVAPIDYRGLYKNAGA